MALRKIFKCRPEAYQKESSGRLDRQAGWFGSGDLHTQRRGIEGHRGVIQEISEEKKRLVEPFLSLCGDCPLKVFEWRLTNTSMLLLELAPQTPILACALAWPSCVPINNCLAYTIRGSLSTYNWGIFSLSLYR